ncbi:MAG: sugar ABC transporter permease [Clostridiales bacterium]|nr:sugar ABC transporter permease [Clostridiales bacterium]MBQ2768871.1 sugar ABC transporter permease [Clostridia bacterium]
MEEKAEKNPMGTRKNGVILAFKNGSAVTRLSFLFMGFGQIARGQIAKGVGYMVLQALFTLYTLFFGGRYILHLFSGDLGSRLSGEHWNEELQIFEKIKGDNSFLILLYGVISIVLALLFVFVWRMNVKGSYENDKRLFSGHKVATLQDDLHELFNRKFYTLLLALPLLGLLIFTVMPLLFMVLIAFTNYDYAHMPPGRLFDWVGFANFKTMFSLSGGTSGFAFVFLRVLLWTFVWAFFATFTNYFLGLIIALLIHKKGIKLKALWRTLFVVAIAIPQFVTLLLMQKILDGDGILNKLLGTNILWLTDQRYFSILPRLMIILVNIWIGVPYTLLMSSGILMNIPTDYYEAARIDGANAVRIFFAITMPYMLHITTPYLITQFVGNINNFNVIWLLTGGGPVDNVYYGGGTQAQSTDLLVTWLYRLTTDRNPTYNVASVIGIVIFVICSVLSLITFNRTSAAKNEGAFQ